MRGLGVDRCERFVHQQQRRLVGHRTGDRDALLHAPGELARMDLAASVQPDGVEGLLGPLAGVGAAHALGTQWQHHVRHRRHPGQQRAGVVLEHERRVLRWPHHLAALEHHAAAAGPQQAADRAQHGRLAGARRADDRHDAPGAHLERHVVHRDVGAGSRPVLVAEVLDRDEHGGVGLRRHDAFPSPASVATPSRRSSGRSHIVNSRLSV